MRIGVVSYANALPLSAGLDRHLPGAELTADTPSRIVKALDAGRLDLGLVPVAALSARPAWRVVPGLGIAGEGEVASVLLVGDRPADRVRTLLPDPASQTSNVLARLWLAHAHGVEPELRTFDPAVPGGIEERLARADATVAIGDAALFWEGTAPLRVDLGAAWTEWTDLPFVFAVWAGPGAGDASVEPALRACFEENAAGGFAALAQGAFPADPGRAARVETYLRENLQYRLGSREEAGLTRFLTLARERGLLPEPPAGSLHVHAG